MKIKNIMYMVIGVIIFVILVLLSGCATQAGKVNSLVNTQLSEKYEKIASTMNLIDYSKDTYQGRSGKITVEKMYYQRGKKITVITMVNNKVIKIGNIGG